MKFRYKWDMFFIRYDKGWNCRKVFIIVKMSLTLHKLNSILYYISMAIILDFFLHMVHEFKRYFLRDFELPWYCSRGYFTCFLGPEYLENIFSRSLIKTTHQRKLRQAKCLLLNSWMIASVFWENLCFGRFYQSKIEKVNT